MAAPTVQDFIGEYLSLPPEDRAEFLAWFGNFIVSRQPVFGAESLHKPQSDQLPAN